MLRLDRGLFYDEYLEFANAEELHIIDELNEQGKLEDKNLHKIRFMNEGVHILVFSETKCKDAATTIPFLMKLAELNNKITVRFLRREGNEEVLERESGEKKVPTFLILDSIGEVVRKYVEFPKGVKDILENTPVEDTQNVIDEMRSGKYNSLIQEDLIKFITGEDYIYKRFDRKDKGDISKL